MKFISNEFDEALSDTTELNDSHIESFNYQISDMRFSGSIANVTKTSSVHYEIESFTNRLWQKRRSSDPLFLLIVFAYFPFQTPSFKYQMRTLSKNGELISQAKHFI